MDRDTGGATAVVHEVHCTSVLISNVQVLDTAKVLDATSLTLDGEVLDAALKHDPAPLL